MVSTHISGTFFIRCRKPNCQRSKMHSVGHLAKIGKYIPSTSQKLHENSAMGTKFDSVVCVKRSETAYRRSSYTDSHYPGRRPVVPGPCVARSGIITLGGQSMPT